MARPRRIDPVWGIVIGVATGVGLAADHRPRTGMWLVAGTLVVAALARLLLSSGDAGSLVVRNREIDVTVLLLLAVAIGVLAAVSPLRI